MSKTRDSLGVQRRWILLQRNDFTCQYCGSRPGNDHLHIDHLVPYSKGGSDHDRNLTTACDRCNMGKLDRIAVPSKMLDGFVGRDGFVTWKRWGQWHLMIADEGDFSVLTFDPDGRDYWIPLDRIHENDWHDHLESKPWLRSDEDQKTIDTFYEDRKQKRIVAGQPVGLTVTELIDEPRPLIELRMASGPRWRDFCDAIDFTRTLVRRSRR